MTTPINLHDDLLTIPEIAALSPCRAAEMVQSVSRSLETAVGTRISAALTSEQLREFDTIHAYQKAHPELEGEPAADWLATYVPNYRLIVLQEYDRLLGSIRSDPDRAVSDHLHEAVSAGRARRPAGPRQHTDPPSRP